MKQNGFSLIELMISIAICGIISASLFSVFNLNKKTIEVQNRKLDSHQNIRTAINFISNSIMNAGYNPLGIALSPIDPLSDETNIKIYADLNGDGKLQTGKSHETVSFYFDKKKETIYKITGVNKEPFISDIADLKFQYNPSAADPETVDVTVTAKDEVTIAYEIFLRNRS